MKKIRQAMLAILMVTVGSWVQAADVPLGAGDVVKITVFGNSDLTVETRVSEAGSISSVSYTHLTLPTTPYV